MSIIFVKAWIQVILSPATKATTKGGLSDGDLRGVERNEIAELRRHLDRLGVGPSSLGDPLAGHDDVEIPDEDSGNSAGEARP